MLRYELTGRMIRYCLNNWPGHPGKRVPDGCQDSAFAVNDKTLGNSPNYVVYQSLYAWEQF